MKDNNGWIKINSKDDYPEGWRLSWLYSDIKQYGAYNPIQEYFYATDGEIIQNVTHHQPIKKPKNPIY
jgi:hypothetical protein